jgi:uncharacterized protein
MARDDDAVCFTQVEVGHNVSGCETSIHRRAFLASAAAAGLGISTNPVQAVNIPPATTTRIDAYTHFVPLKFLEFAERYEAQPSPYRGLFMRKRTLIDVDERLHLLDRNEVDIHVLVPLPWLETFPRIASDQELAPQAARIMNDELAAVVATNPRRFRGVALLPAVNAEATIAELHRAVKELGFVGAYLAVGPTAKRMDHPDFEPLYKALVDLDATLWLHPSRPPALPEYVDEKVSRFIEWQTIGWLHDTTSAMYRIVFSGVFERYPDVRIVTHHHGAFLPVFAQRLEASWAIFEDAGMVLPTRVSKPYIEHFRKFYCDTAVFGFAPRVLELALDFFGPERVLFGSDSPMDITSGQYFTSETLRSIDAMMVSREVRNGILSENARRILKIT